MLFENDDIILKENDPQEDYRRRNDDEKKSISWGQRKLLLTLLNFILDHCLEVENPVILYCGALKIRNIIP